MKKLWGGRFKKKTHPLVEKFTSSISFDKRLAKYDVLCSMAHAKMLGKCAIIPKKDAAKILRGLSGILKQIKNGTFAYDDKAEDIHTNIHNALRKKIGEPAEKLHTARSRNDLVVTDLRLYSKDEIDEISAMIAKLQKALSGFAKKNKNVLIPGYTHMQKAQPVPVSMHILAYVNMLQRDRERLADAKKRVNILPLGSCALAGTSLPINRKFLARELGFSAICKNTIEAVSERDFVIEILSAISTTAMHLSRIAEDLVLWSTQEFGFVNIDDAFCTGSSIMPHKKNPDVLELIRGNTGMFYGNLVWALTMMKSLPLSYNRDMQLDKKPLFESADAIKAEIEILEKLIANTSLNKQLIKRHLDDELLSATAIAEYLVKKGVPFAKAHEAVGKLIRYSLDTKKKIKDMPLERIKSFSGAFDRKIYKILGK
ncbi:MAG: argininosuccinate lyase [Candidatus Omnitrophota bacterium]